MLGKNGKSTIVKKSKDNEVQKLIEDLVEVCVKHNNRFSINEINIKALLVANGDIEMVGDCSHFKSIVIKIEPDETKVVINEELNYDTFRAPLSKENKTDGK